MHSGPAPADPGRDEDPARCAPEPAEDETVAWEPVVTRPDWMTQEDWRAYLDAAVGDDQPSDEEDPPPEDYDLRELAAECRQVAEDQARVAANAARLGTTGALAAIAAARRGPGQPGSAHRFPGEYPGRAAQFAAGMLMDTMPGRPELAGFADEAAGERGLLRWRL
jgi:hypothetical protein